MMIHCLFVYVKVYVSPPEAQIMEEMLASGSTRKGQQVLLLRLDKHQISSTTGTDRPTARKKRSKRQPDVGTRCVMGGCSNTAKDGFSIYKMPQGPESVVSAWVRKIQSTRSTFKKSAYTGQISVCSGHFQHSQFNASELMMYRQRFRNNPPSLKPDAVPVTKEAVNPFPADFFVEESSTLNDTSEFDQLIREVAEIKAKAVAKKSSASTGRASTSLTSNSDITMTSPSSPDHAKQPDKHNSCVIRPRALSSSHSASTSTATSTSHGLSADEPPDKRRRLDGGSAYIYNQVRHFLSM